MQNHLQHQGKGPDVGTHIRVPPLTPTSSHGQMSSPALSRTHPGTRALQQVPLEDFLGSVPPRVGAEPVCSAGQTAEQGIHGFAEGACLCRLRYPCSKMEPGWEGNDGPWAGGGLLLTSRIPSGILRSRIIRNLNPIFPDHYESSFVKGGD